MTIMRIRLAIASVLVALARWVAPRREVAARLMGRDAGIDVREVQP